MSKCKVLIVDDIAENIAQVVDMLSNLDIEIKKAYGGKEASYRTGRDLQA